MISEFRYHNQKILETDIGIPITKLIESVYGGNSKIQGTCVHRKVGYHLGPIY